MKSMLLPLKRYAQFDGRAGRKEYWMFQLFLFLVILVGYAGMGIGVAMESNLLTGLFGVLLGVFSLAVIVPAIAVGIRRLHDIDKSGWFLLVGLIPFVGGLVLLVFNVLPGTPGDNRFGPVPPTV
ncbi:DUF805 domain-containing protein [Stenotrophomonas rhizophila]|uniref:DUF805 domain-containing protein n=1 Tax=Stenotrophomonas rhizophila TaxID=216778 RepID=UPI001E40518A|nr:DUF805 domain-containing protein [Stenotrophomonas rhizophila]MCC7664358.1 DUF805 domain-containing protein [Stenotrophomonas rhizophila]